jgi:predicted nucleotidyltransferase
MRIQRDQEILAYPAVKIRQLMRETIRGRMTLQSAQRILKCPASSARRVIRDLEAEGFVESVYGRLEPSTKGRALAMARAGPPLRRETAERLITDIVNRARSVNRDGKWAYRVGTLVIFGSCVRGANRPNDVDIACELVPRFDGEKQRLIEQVRRDARDQDFRNLSQWASWPKVEVFRFLKGRARGLSIHELDDWVLNLKDHRIIFRHQNKSGK